mgnify:FL=1
MTEARDETPAWWRIVLLTHLPGGQIYPRIAGEMWALGHRPVGVLTAPLHEDATRMVVQCGDGPLTLLNWTEA